MKYFPLVWSGIARKPIRTTLTFISVTIALFLVAVLHGVVAGLDHTIDKMSNTRLRVMSKASLSQPLPRSHLQRIENLPGVAQVGYYAFFGGYHQSPRNTISAGAVDATRLDVFEELELDPAARDAMTRNLSGAIIGYQLAERRGWKVGDRIALQSSVWLRSDGTNAWPVEIVGIYRFRNDVLPGDELWVNYEYLDRSRTFAKNRVMMFIVSVADGHSPENVAKAIDALFANSPDETFTQSEQDFVRGMTARLGNLAGFVNTILASVLFALFFLTSNVAMQSLRERTPELAVLKTVGYSNGQIVVLLVAESLIICLPAALLGLAAAMTVFPIVFQVAGGVASQQIPPVAAVTVLALAIGLACLTSAIPARRAVSMQIVAALRN